MDTRSLGADHPARSLQPRPEPASSTGRARSRPVPQAPEARSRLAPDQSTGRATTTVQTLVLPCPADEELARILSVPDDADHKYTRGVVGLWAGSEAYPGAGVLTASAAVRAGAGMVRVVAPRRVEDLVLARRPEVVVGDGHCQAYVLGPGTDPREPARLNQLRQALARCVGEGTAAVVDAGALPLVAEMVSSTREAVCMSACHVLTPHAGEAAQLLSALGQEWSRQGVEQAALEAAASLVELTGATVVLKGTPTVVASSLAWIPQGREVISQALPLPSDGPQTLEGQLRRLPGYERSVGVWTVDSGPGWLATAGSGDVLAGILGAVLAGMQARAEGAGGRPPREPFLEPAVCAALAVRIHARSGWAASLRAAGAVTHGDGVGPAAGSPAGSPPPGVVGGPVAALDLTEVLPGVMAELLAARE